MNNFGNAINGFLGNLALKRLTKSLDRDMDVNVLMEVLAMANLGGVLTGSTIQRYHENDEICIEPFNPKNVNPNSYNLTTGNTITVYKQLKVIDLKKPETYKETVTYELDEDEGFILRPGNLYLVPTSEIIKTGKYIPIITGRSSIGRLGIQVHNEAGFGDVGYQGRFTLQLKVTYPTVLYPNLPIAQVYFITPVGDVTPYSGSYQGSMGAVASKWRL